MNENTCADTLRLTEELFKADARYQTAVRRIAELEARQRWIPVSERLPEPINEEGWEHSEYVLVCDANTGRRDCEYHDYYTGYWGGSDYQATWTHWMPLPQPPQPATPAPHETEGSGEGEIE